ncbi:MAG TPA: cytochrome c oxidase assembly protein [Acidimicrobiales bacterium]|nr:cytochrome c oxidase assembly protein [Acidimicrobiales bacterium]
MQTDAPDLVAQALMAASLAAYMWAAHRLHHRGRRWRRGRTASFGAGIACVWLAVASVLVSYDETDVTAHIVQHLLLMMLAPPLLALGRPLTLLARAGPRRARKWVARRVRGRAARLLTNPVVGAALYLGSMYAMLTSRAVYRFLDTHQAAHDASHLWLLAAGLVYFEPLLGEAAVRRSHPVRIIPVLAVMPFEVMVGIWLRYQTRPFLASNTLADTQRAGEAFVVGSTLLATVWLGIIVAQWAGRELREERRRARRPPSLEWTTPWWVGPGQVSGPAGCPVSGPPAGPAG